MTPRDITAPHYAFCKFGGKRPIDTVYRWIPHIHGSICIELGLTPLHLTSSTRVHTRLRYTAPLRLPPGSRQFVTVTGCHSPYLTWFTLVATFSFVERTDHCLTPHDDTTGCATCRFTYSHSSGLRRYPFAARTFLPDWTFQPHFIRRFPLLFRDATHLPFCLRTYLRYVFILLC